MSRSDILKEPIEMRRHQQIRRSKSNLVKNSLKSLNLTPKKIKSQLDECIVGQEAAKKSLSVVFYGHYQSAKQKIHGYKSNILLMGPSGVGKTYLVCHTAKILHLPFVNIDATGLTEAGYSGDDVENILYRLLETANYDIHLAEHGIVLIDEFDKLSRPVNLMHRDVSGEGVQQALLKLLEGRVFSLQNKRNRHASDIVINTKNILFICAGSFEKMKEKNKIIGLHNTKQLAISQNLINSGMITEIIGRLPIKIQMETLSLQDLKIALTEIKNCVLDEYKNFFRMHNTELQITDKAKDFIAEMAIQYKTGFRALKSIVDDILLEYMYDLKCKKYAQILLIDVHNDCFIGKYILKKQPK